MFFASVLTVLGIMFLAFKLGRRFVKRAIGMDWLSDILVSVCIVWLFGITATISGMMIGITVGVLFSIGLFIAKKFLPHEVYTKVDGKRRWVSREGEWTTAFRRTFRNWFNRITNFV